MTDWSDDFGLAYIYDGKHHLAKTCLLLDSLSSYYTSFDVLLYTTYFFSIIADDPFHV